MAESFELWRLVDRIRHADMSPIDRELLRPVFAAHDGAQVIAVPEYVEKRIRHYAGRVTQQQ